MVSRIVDFEGEVRLQDRGDSGPRVDPRVCLIGDESGKIEMGSGEEECSRTAITKVDVANNKPTVVLQPGYIDEVGILRNDVRHHLLVVTKQSEQ